MHPVVAPDTAPVDPLKPSSASAWDLAMSLTIDQLQPRPSRQASEPAEPLPVPEAHEIDWAEWCAAATPPAVGQTPTKRPASR